jgi:hypothetical protein
MVSLKYVRKNSSSFWLRQNYLVFSKAVSLDGRLIFSPFLKDKIPLLSDLDKICLFISKAVSLDGRLIFLSFSYRRNSSSSWIKQDLSRLLKSRLIGRPFEILIRRNSSSFWLRQNLSRLLKSRLIGRPLNFFYPDRKQFFFLSLRYSGLETNFFSFVLEKIFFSYISKMKRNSVS